MTDRTGADRTGERQGVVSSGRETPADVSIVIPTCRRPHLLPDLVTRCFEQRDAAAVGLEVIVVDNCPQRSAEPVIDGLVGRFPGLCYLHEPCPGVSYARNRGVNAARGRWVALIDDDEYPLETWLAALLQTQRRFDADVVFGPIHPMFAEPVRRFPSLFSAAFTLSSDAVTGTEIRPQSPLSRFQPQYCYRVMGGSNVLLVRDRCFATTEPFSPLLARTGAEDSLFFLDLYATGRKFIWCREAVAMSQVPAERMTLRYLLERHFRGGQAAAFICLMRRPRHMARMFELMAVGAAQVVICGPLALLLLMVSREKAIRAYAVCLGGAGKLLWMRRFRREYYGVGG
jgi:glycosyltransferase involved in cell wall biosynthesis